MSKSSSFSRANKRGASVRASAFWVAKMIPSFTECRHGNESKKAFGPEQIRCRVDHGRQQTQRLRTPAGVPLEQVRLRDKTIRGMIWPLLLSGKRRPVPHRDSFGEELRAACMTAIISGPRYGSTVGTSLAISANSRVWATRPDFAYEYNTRRPSHYSPEERKRLQTSEARCNEKPGNVFFSWEYSSELRVIPSEHDNATSEAVCEEWQVLPALLGVCSEPQIRGKSCGHDSVNSPAPGCSNRRHPHFF